jgi:WD40 repeat protein
MALGGYPNVYIFELNNTKPIVTLPAEGDVMKLTYSPDGIMLAGQIGNSSIQVWDVSTGQSLYKTDNINCWSADMRFTTGEQVLSAQCGWTTYHWNARDGSLIDKKEDKSRPNSKI